ncbi:MAG: HNH endonuclease [Sphingomonadaceae bacterium]|nr:HNH endonuclease [Sphingomonadaceae bacterium]
MAGDPSPGHVASLALWCIHPPMPPDFPKKTIDVLAKRAAFLCSNPDCRASTVGPNSEDSSATVIGEAAHIYAARKGQARYRPDMTDTTRSEISNAIWLCRNCHKQVDSDANQYPAEVLFVWREQHDEFVASNLGSQTDKARYELQQHNLKQFDGYPHLILRIASDKPDGWEWSLTAALMRHLNAPVFRRLQDVRDGVFVAKPQIIDDDEITAWIHDAMG